jgi:phosphonoacetate hydrolase
MPDDPATPAPAADPISVNGRLYARPRVPTAVICLDGLDPDYLDDGFARGLLPRLAELAAAGSYLPARAQLPSFTNPNNLSIVTGCSPAVHGLPGNHYLAPDGVEVPLDRAEQLRAPSIHAAFAAAGVRVLAVTAKEKLRALLGAGGVPCVSAEHADRQSLEGLDAPVSSLLPRPKPDIYDWDASHYALELGLALAERFEIELLYVSLTDAVQHAHPPGAPLSDRYLIGLDLLIGRFLDRGFELGLVADHGMNAKTGADGQPQIRFLGDELNAAGIHGAHVVLPITDPYVVHHAALGSACWIHLADDERGRARAVLEEIPGVEEVLSRGEAAGGLGLPSDRIGDLVVLGDRATVFGRHAAGHDLSALRGPLRSHGGRHEQEVPLLTSRRVATPATRPSNADIHALLLGVEG